MSEKYIRVEDAMELIHCPPEGTVGGTATSHRATKAPPALLLNALTPAEIMAGMWVPVSERLPPKVREVFGSKVMMWVCGVMCVFQGWQMARQYKRPGFPDLLYCPVFRIS